MSGSASNASNASSPVASPSPSADGSEPPNKRRRIPPKPRFSHPLPACKTCQRTNVQLLHGGRKLSRYEIRGFTLLKSGRRVLPCVYRYPQATAPTSAASPPAIPSVFFLLSPTPSLAFGASNHIQLLGTASAASGLISCAVVCVYHYEQEFS